MRHLQWLIPAAAAGIAGIVAAFTFSASSRPALAGPLDARRAYGYLVDVCRVGPRPSGSRGMEQQQKLIVEHFEKHGGTVQFQTFDAAHPLDGSPVRMSNIIVSWHPDAKERVLLACHYDTRPFPDEDRFNPRGVFLGANDGASGVALFMELAHHLPRLKPTYGVDFVLFDGEELVFGREGEYFLGSKHFALEYLGNSPAHRYVYGVLVDMIGDRSLNIYKELNSLKYAPDLVDSVWATARRLGVREFIDRRRHEVQDDHLPLNQIARIPTIDIIDFDYGPPENPYWHTTQDVPQKCSGESLAKVGHVLLTWLESVPRPRGGGERR
ncbi:MAG TPA: M28 family peptidase [Planctomycetaceae bacterium]|nr:M28 family peptidase [Planctomycetaceae bacterium]